MIAISVVKLSGNVCSYNAALQSLCKHLQNSRPPDKPRSCLVDVDISTVEGRAVSVIDEPTCTLCLSAGISPGGYFLERLWVKEQK